MGLNFWSRVRVWGSVNVMVRVRYVSLLFVGWFLLVISHDKSSGLNMRFSFGGGGCWCERVNGNT